MIPQLLTFLFALTLFPRNERSSYRLCASNSWVPVSTTNHVSDYPPLFSRVEYIFASQCGDDSLELLYSV